MNNPRDWSDDEIRDYFDGEPNLRMSQLARMTGKSIPELKRILMPGRRASKVAPRFSKEDAEAWAEKRFDDIEHRLSRSQNAFDHNLRVLPERGNPKHFVDGFGDWWEQAEPAMEMPKDRYYVLGFLYADDFGRAKHPEWDGRLASAERVASRYKEAYRTEKGPGGLLFRFDRDGIYIQTESQDPHGQVYSATTTMSGSGKIALRNLAKMWNDPKIRREIMSLRKQYDVTEYIDNALREMGTRGRLRWHSWHSPD